MKVPGWLLPRVIVGSEQAIVANGKDSTKPE
jgi:hypothetical protein